MKTNKIISLICILIAILLTGCEKQTNNNAQIKIGIILPIKHQALDEIVLGFKTTLKQLYHRPLQFDVQNAQGDANLMHAIIEQMRTSDDKLIVPIATSTSQMTIAAKPTQPVIALAADISQSIRTANPKINIAVVDDELTPANEIRLIHHIYPKLKNIVLIHSTSDKIFPEVNAIKVAARQYAINVNCIMVQNLPELYSSANAISSNTEALLILKDNLIASCLDTLIKIATDHKIPLITSDDGTVQKGAMFALGVHEKQIGAEGAKLAFKILTGTSANQLPITKMTQGTVFYNQTAINKFCNGSSCKNSLQQIIVAAKNLHLPIEDLTPKNN